MAASVACLALTLALLLVLTFTVPASAALLDKSARPQDAEHMVVAMQHMNHDQKIAIARYVLGIDQAPTPLPTANNNHTLNSTARAVHCLNNCWKNTGCQWEYHCINNRCCAF